MNKKILVVLASAFATLAANAWLASHHVSISLFILLLTLVSLIVTGFLPFKIASFFKRRRDAAPPEELGVMEPKGVHPYTVAPVKITTQQNTHASYFLCEKWWRWSKTLLMGQWKAILLGSLGSLLPTLAHIYSLEYREYHRIQVQITKIEWSCWAEIRDGDGCSLLESYVERRGTDSDPACPTEQEVPIKPVHGEAYSRGSNYLVTFTVTEGNESISRGTKYFSAYWYPLQVKNSKDFRLGRRGWIVTPAFPRTSSKMEFSPMPDDHP